MQEPSLGEQIWEVLVTSLFDPAFLIKALVLLAVMPIIWPAMKLIWEELNAALAPEGGVFGRRERTAVPKRPPSEDPWISVPLASHRSRGGGGAFSQPAARRKAPSPARGRRPRR